MLRLSPLNRFSASECLREIAKLPGINTQTQTPETEYGTPKKKTAFQDARYGGDQSTTAEEAKTETECSKSTQRRVSLPDEKYRSKELERGQQRLESDEEKVSNRRQSKRRCTGKHVPFVPKPR